MKKIVRALLVGLVAFTTGCASIISGSTQSVSFNSTPAGASIIVNGADMGRTPATLKLERGDTYAVVIELDGYQSQSVNITRTVNGWVWGNILIGGLIGLVIDAASGAMYSLTPDQVSAALGQQVAMTGEDDALVMGFAMNIDPSWQKIGQLEAR